MSRGTMPIIVVVADAEEKAAAERHRRGRHGAGTVSIMTKADVAEAERLAQAEIDARFGRVHVGRQ